MIVEIIFVSGAREDRDIPKQFVWNQLKTILSAEGFDTVNLRDGRVMIVDDTGMIDGKPVNPEATKLYHSICIPGTVHCIHGDVAIALDKDFA